MLTSLLTLYIVSSLESNLSLSANQEINKPALVRTASLNFSNLAETKILPIKNPEMLAPVIEAEASIAIDLKTKEVLFEKNAHKSLQIGSITKLMTILIILEENRFDEIVTVSKNASAIDGSTMHLITDEQITVENLLFGALINSANDAAIALAEHNAGSVEAFVEKMNKRSNELGLLNTHFSNPVGLDNANNYSSAKDIATLGAYVYHNKFIQKAAVIKTMTVSSVNAEHKHKLASTNDLLDSYLKIKGLKTGKTPQAGLCLVAIAENDQKQEILTVVLDSPARFEETKILIDWVFRAYNWSET